jgi:DNA-binding NarL/FixJ family response regulator
MNNVRILIADDHELVREGLRSILSTAHPEWEIVAVVSTGGEAIAMGEALRPNVAILHLSMPAPNALAVTERLTEMVRGIKVLILTVHTAEPVMRHIKRAGAKAFLAKNEAPEKLVAAVERMLRGEPFFASESATRTPAELAEGEHIPMQYLLTPRELEVVRLLMDGLGNKEIGGRLDINVRTVESHRADIFARLGVDSLGELVKAAIRDKLI